MYNNIKEKVKQLEPLLTYVRRYLHQNPELAGQENNTAQFLHTKLYEAGIEASIIQTEVGPGVVGILGNNPNKETIAFRADMDALPINDKKVKNYCSKTKGVMHACGHDFNMTCVLGAALALASFKDELDVNVKFIFQPAEECPDGGAQALIRKNVMEGVKVIWTIHAAPSIPAGKVGLRYGPITSATDVFKVAVKGKSGHSARPYRAVDAIFVANKIIDSFYSGIPRSVDPLTPFVISVGKLYGGDAANIISELCEMEGTVRTFDPAVRERIHDLMQRRAYSIAQTYDARAELKWEYGPPPVINDKVLTRLAQETACKLLGEENIIKIAKPSMGAEDFANYLAFAPGMLIRVGTGGEDCSYPLHSSLFDVDERSISVAVSLLSAICFNFQSNACSSRDYVKTLIV